MPSVVKKTQKKTRGWLHVVLHVPVPYPYLQCNLSRWNLLLFFGSIIICSFLLRYRVSIQCYCWIVQARRQAHVEGLHPIQTPSQSRDFISNSCNRPVSPIKTEGQQPYKNKCLTTTTNVPHVILKHRLVCCPAELAVPQHQGSSAQNINILYRPASVYDARYILSSFQSSGLLAYLCP